MITLDGVAEVLRVELSGAVTTTEPDFKTSWDDNDDVASLFTFGETDGVTTGATPVVIVPAPAAGVQRNAKRVNVFNRDTVAVVLLFTFFDGVNVRNLGKFMLDPDWSVVWESCSGWTIYDENGIPQGGGGGGVTVHNDLSGRSVADTHPAASVTNTPAGDIAATEVQAAIDELDAEKAALVHATRHENGGADEINVAGLSGLLADDQNPVDATETVVGGAEIATQVEVDAGTDDTRIVTPLKLANTTTTPEAHATTHENGGSDEINVAGLSGELADDQPPKAHVLDSAVHTISGKDDGQFLRATGATTFAFEDIIISRGNVRLKPKTGENIITWRAPFACTVTNVRGYRVGGTGATINARKNGTLNHLASALSLTSADTWQDGGAVQNTAYAAGDKMEIMIVTVTAAPDQVAVQVDLTRP